MQFSESIRDSYSELFEHATSDGNESEDYFKEFGWYPSIKKLAKNNVLNIEKVCKVNIHTALYFLSCDHAETEAKIKEMNKTNNTRSIEL